MDKIKTDAVLIVEGKYDRIRLSEIVDGLVLETDGFAVYSDKERRMLFRKLAETHEIILLTDSDAAGFQIRAFLTSFLPPERVHHALIPDVYGKEKRKEKPSKEGKLGVEGISGEILREILLQAGISCEDRKTYGEPVTVTDLFEYGLTGREDSTARRRVLLQKLGFPTRTSVKMLLNVVNATMTREAFLSLL